MRDMDSRGQVVFQEMSGQHVSCRLCIELSCGCRMLQFALQFQSNLSQQWVPKTGKLLQAQMSQISASDLCSGSCKQLCTEMDMKRFYRFGGEAAPAEFIGIAPAGGQE